jgi:ADP-heptose:LPS heptosyltransferase
MAYSSIPISKTTMTRFLALIPGGIDEQFLSFPMLESLQKQYPQAQIDVVVEPRAKAAYRISRVVKQILAYDFKGRNGPADWGNLIGWIREREYDAVLSLDKSWFNGMLLWLTGVPTRVGFAGQPAVPFLTQTVQRKSQQYAAEMVHDLLSGLGLSASCPPLNINVPRQDIEWAEAELKRLEISPGQGYVLLHGGSLADHAAKGKQNTYPVSNWQALAKGFQERQADLPVLLVQFPGDRAWFTPLVQKSPGLKVSTPEDFGKFAALVAGANLMVCTESEAMYLGVAVNTYLMVLFGSGDPTQVLPTHERFTVMRSQTGKVGDIAPIQILEKVFGK